MEQTIGRIRWKKKKGKDGNAWEIELLDRSKQGERCQSQQETTAPLLQEKGRLASTGVGQEGIGLVKMLTPAKFWDAADVYMVRTKRNGSLKQTFVATQLQSQSNICPDSFRHRAVSWSRTQSMRHMQKMRSGVNCLHVARIQRPTLRAGMAKTVMLETKTSTTKVR